MKRLFCVLLAVMLLGTLTAFAGEGATDANIPILNAIVKAFLDAEDYTYRFEDDSYYMSFKLDNTLGSCEVRMDVFYDQVAVTAYCPIKVKEEYRDLMAKYLTLANYMTFYAQFRMDYTDGKVASRSQQSVETVMPGNVELAVLLTMAINNLEDYGDGVAQIALMGADPQVAFDEAQAKIEAK